MPTQVHCAYILVKSESEAKAVLERLKKGEEFSAVAQASIKRIAALRCCEKQIGNFW